MVDTFCQELQTNWPTSGQEATFGLPPTTVLSRGHRWSPRGSPSVLIGKPAGDAPPAIAGIRAERDAGVYGERTKGDDAGAEAVDDGVAGGLIRQRVDVNPAANEQARHDARFSAAGEVALFPQRALLAFD